MSSEIHKHADIALAELHQLSREVGESSAAKARIEKTRTAIMSLVASAASGIGECRKDYPYATLKPVIDQQGNFMWCCTHPTAHCSK